MLPRADLHGGGVAPHCHIALDHEARPFVGMEERAVGSEEVLDPPQEEDLAEMTHTARGRLGSFGTFHGLQCAHEIVLRCH